jgi:hypothetical protein
MHWWNILQFNWALDPIWQLLGWILLPHRVKQLHTDRLSWQFNFVLPDWHFVRIVDAVQKWILLHWNLNGWRQHRQQSI